MPPRLTYANVTSTLALVLALSAGGAYAAGQITSADIKNESVKSTDLKNGQVRGPDLAGGVVSGDKLGPEAVTGDKIAAGAVTGADVANGSLKGEHVADGSLRGADIDESTLDVGGFFSAAAANVGGCTADSGGLSICASGSIDLPRPGRVLLNATGEWSVFAFDDSDSGSDTTTAAFGYCVLQVDGNGIGTLQSMGERDSDSDITHFPGGPSGTLALAALSTQLGAGSHTYAVSCLETDGDIDWTSINLVAALVD